MSAARAPESDAQDSQAHGPLMERLFEIELTEGSWSLESEGRVPTWLRGDYYLCGPSAFDRHGIRYQHWLDGDGAVTRLRFASEGVQLTQRFVHTAKRRQEEEAGRAIFRTFGTSFDGDELKRGIGLESPANVSAFRFGEHLLAFGEQGLPFALDPESLETRGEHTFGGRLNAISPLSAHPCFDPESGEMFNFGISFSKRQPSLTLYRFSAEGELIFRRRHPLPYPCSTHDFILSRRYAIFYLSPHVLDVSQMMSGGASVMEALDWRPELGNRLLVLDRETGEKHQEIRLEAEQAAYCLHLINAFETEEELMIDIVELERPVYDQYQPLPDLFRAAPRGGPRRLVLDGQSFELTRRQAIDYELCPDFPVIEPHLDQRPYDDLWLLGISKTPHPGRKFFDQLAHLRWSQPTTPDVWTAAPGCYLGGEPVFLPATGEPGGHGVVLCQHFDAELRSSSFLLFSAHDVASGPIARLRVPHAMPLGFHAAYYPEA